MGDAPLFWRRIHAHALRHLFLGQYALHWKYPSAGVGVYRLWDGLRHARDVPWFRHPLGGSPQGRPQRPLPPFVDLWPGVGHYCCGTVQCPLIGVDGSVCAAGSSHRGGGDLRIPSVRGWGSCCPLSTACWGRWQPLLRVFLWVLRPPGRGNAVLFRRSGSCCLCLAGRFSSARAWAL